MKLAEMTWSEVAQLNRDRVVVYPIAALEQHSLHLPLMTDSILCGAVADAIEAALPGEVLLLPVQWLGGSTHHLGFAGTLSAEPETHINLIAEPLRCLLRHGFHRFLVLNGHGGNTDAYHLALRGLAVEYPEARLCGASYWDPSSAEIADILEGPLKAVGHACEFETSLMLAVRPELVRRDRIRNDFAATQRPDELKGIYIAPDMKARTSHGGVGYPELASAEKGRALLQAVTARLVAAIRALG